MKKVKEYIKENQMLQKGDKVLVALSGGPDSVCLLHMLVHLKDYFEIEIGAVHINHMLRGSDAIKDEEYAKWLCDKLGVSFYLERIDINSICKRENISHELAGRRERYKAFEKIKNKERYNKIAVAHNANDQAETMIMRLMRGAGIEGLTGIKPMREDGVIRPILSLSRDEIEKYCSDNSLSPRIDNSNYEKIYNRNKVRLDIIPYMKENFNQDIVETINRTVRLLQIDNEFLEEQSENLYCKYTFKEKDKLILKNNLFKNEKMAMITRIVKKAIKEQSNSLENFEMKHIYDVIDLANGETGKEIHLTNNIVAINSYNDIILTLRNSNNINETLKDLIIDKEKMPQNILYGHNKIYMEIISRKNSWKISNNDLIKYFDYDKIEGNMVIRNRRDGDRIKPLGIIGTKKLKDIFIDMKIPRAERDSIPIVTFGEKIAWVVGCKVSQEFIITKDTKRILKISFTRKE